MILSFGSLPDNDNTTYINGKGNDIIIELIALLCSLHNVNPKIIEEGFSDFIAIYEACSGDKITDTDINNYLRKKEKTNND